MARLVQGLVGPATSSRPLDPLTDLTRLLSRLQQTVLHADAERERRLRTNEYERKKVENNIQYARSLLTKAEQEALMVKILSRRQELQTDLSRKRELLEQLMEHMLELEETGGPEDDDESSEGEDILSVIIETPSESMESRSPDVQPEDLDDDSAAGESGNPIADMPEPPGPLLAARSGDQGRMEAKPDLTPLVPPTDQPALRGLETVTSQTVRSRHKGTEGEKEKEQNTAQGTATALFGHRRDPSLGQTATTEAILDNQRAEQDALSESILKMAGQLKASSQAFSMSLEEDKNVVNRAGEGLDKSERGLEAAARRMGTLRRMTEGKSWWARMMLYAWIYGLMVVLVLLVFVLPKIRFSSW